MDEPITRKERKINKQKKNKELNGKYNSKYIRMVENRMNQMQVKN